MFQLGKTVVSEEIIENDFLCNLNACKGGCCVEGDAGAPLEAKETDHLKAIFPKLKPFLSAEGLKAIEKQGTHITTAKGDLETPLVDGKECAYVVFDEKRIAFCGIEQAYRAGAINWQKPISCHLYPIRLKEYSAFTAINYHKWQLCKPACVLGKSQQMPVYQFVKDALIRKFGADWYADLEKAAERIRQA